MIRKLLATTAIVSLVATGAIADDAMKPANDQAQAATNENKAAATTDNKVFFEVETDDMLASRLIGQPVYTGTGDNAEKIGDVNDIVMSPDGQAEAVLIGVGGFLGVGEKEVAVRYDQLEWAEKDGENWLTANLDREWLEGAPAFDKTALLETHESGGESAEKQPREAMTDENRPASDMSAENAPKAEENKADGAQADASSGAAEEKMAESGETDDSMRTGAIGDMQPVDRATLSADAMIGATVYGAGDDNIGEVGDVLLTTDGQVEAYVVDVGGFLGIGEKHVALDASELEVFSDGNGGFTIRTAFTQEQLESQAEYSPQAYKDDRNSVILR